MAKIEEGVPLKWAAPKCGIPHQTVVRWVKRGRNGEQPYASFYAAVRDARGAAVSELVEICWRHARSDKGAAIAMRLLECYARSFFGQQRESSLANLKTNQANPAQAMSMEQLQAAMDERARTSDEPSAKALREQIIADHQARTAGAH